MEGDSSLDGEAKLEFIVKTEIEDIEIEDMTIDIESKEFKSICHEAELTNSAVKSEICDIKSEDDNSIELNKHKPLDIELEIPEIHVRNDSNDEVKLENEEMISAVKEEIDSTVKTVVGRHDTASRDQENSYTGILEEFIIIDGLGKMKTYKCSKCNYDSNRKVNVAKHLLVHKEASELEMFKCNECSYESKRKGNLTLHQKAHHSKHLRIIKHLELFKCTRCSYQSNHKGWLDHHLLVHKKPSELQMLKCNKCNYQSKHKSRLDQHLLNHKDPSELEMFKCNQCGFQSRFQSSLQLHKRVHKEES